jgi:2-methylcitrate dehydratase PrpD
MSVANRPGGAVSDNVSEFIAQTRAENIPARVREIAKLHMLDGLATMLGGAKEASSRLLRRHFSPRRMTAGATAFGTSIKFSAERAALINGVQGHVLDYDDAQLATLPSRPLGQQTHPTTPVLAAALALAQSRHRTGSALLASYIVGVEVACRLGDAVDPSHYLDGFHPTGTLGVFGAAAACVHLLKLEPRSISHALGIAGTLASGLRANRGTMAKGLNAGRAAENGVLAATLASNGFTASQDIFADPMGFFAAMCKSRVNEKLLRFGKPFFFTQPGVAIKLYPCAGVLHPALDVSLDLRRRYAIKTENIACIRVTLDADASLPMVYDRPKDGLEAKFSLQFAVAVAIVEGAAGLTQFTDERVRDPKIRTLMKRIELVRRPAGKQKSRKGIDTEIEIKLKTGANYRDRAAIARGHPNLPVSRAEIEEKFRQCADGVLPTTAVTKFLSNFSQLERVSSIAAWLAPLRPPRH